MIQSVSRPSQITYDGLYAYGKGGFRLQQYPEKLNVSPVRDYLKAEGVWFEARVVPDKCRKSSGI